MIPLLLFATLGMFVGFLMYAASGAANYSGTNDGRGQPDDPEPGDRR